MANTSSGAVPFDTNPFFAGGAGMFIQYYDVIKPVWLYAVIKMIISNEDYGLPVNIIRKMSIGSLLEWYLNRRYVNPLKQLDWANEIQIDELDSLLADIMTTDDTIYSLCPPLNISRLFSVYTKQHMQFPVFVYTTKFDPFVKADVKQVFPGITVAYVYGDLKEALKKCSNNFTYMFSDIELMKNACEILHGTYSHILLASDYRYNYSDYKKHTKYDLQLLMSSHPFLRLGTISVWDGMNVDGFSNVLSVD